jgi:hypothetical protein
MRGFKQNRNNWPEHELNSTAPDRLPPYAALLLTRGEVIIYDTTNHKAWIQSSVSVALEEML